jgi:uncharacterized protein YcbX
MSAVVSRLSVTAIKGFGIREVDEVELRHAGAVGNREFFTVDEDLRLYSVTRTPDFLSYWSLITPDGQLQIGHGPDIVHQGRTAVGAPVTAHFFGERWTDGRLVVGDWDEVLSDIAGKRLRLVRSATPAGGFDVHPATLHSEASVAALGSEADGSSLDPRRFRMLITCAGTEAFEEDTWTGRVASVGTAALTFGGPVRRCVAVQRHPIDGSSEVNALRLIKDRRGIGSSELGRGLTLGVYAEVSGQGVVRVDDQLRF